MWGTAEVHHRVRCMEILEIGAYAFAALLVVILILWHSNYEDEKPEDVDFR